MLRRYSTKAPFRVVSCGQRAAGFTSMLSSSSSSSPSSTSSFMLQYRGVALAPKQRSTASKRLGSGEAEEDADEDFFEDDDDVSPTPLSAGTGAAEERAAALEAMTRALPIINPFTRRVSKRDSPVIQQLLSIGFIITANNIIAPGPTFSLANVDLKAVKNVKARKALLELKSYPDGDVMLRERCLSAKESIAGTFVPAKLTTIPDPVLEELEMTPDQANFIGLAKKGYSLYIGGSAGTGKTMLLKAIHRELTAKGVRVAMTATTGVSSVHLGGNTFHSAFGVPMGDKGKWDVAALRAVDAIVIDEVSLLSKRLVEEFSRAAQVARLSDAPFGGIQLILCGDFLQLSHEDNTGAHDPCYASPLFRHFIALQLITPLRHKEGDKLLNLLRKLRVGEYDPLISELTRDPPPNTNPVYIFPKRRSVVTVNAMKLAALSTEQLLFTPQCGPTHVVGSFTQSLQCHIPRHDRRTLVRALLGLLKERIPNSRATETDVVVMPTRGTENQYCLRLRNAKATTVYDYIPPTPRATWDTVVRDVVADFGGYVEETHHDGEPDTILPYSVSLSGNMAYSSEAILHLKVGCQVMINRNLSRTVANGALGTIESFSPLNHLLMPQRENASSIVSSVSGGARAFERLKTFARLPVVRLQTGELVQIPPCAEPIGGGPETYYYGHNLFTLPLQLGYAFTVHKVQGLTIDGPVVVNCDDYFRCPHLIYVACSRVRKLEQLTVKGVTAREIEVNANSLAFAQSLAPATETPIIGEFNFVADWRERELIRSVGVTGVSSIELDDDNHIQNEDDGADDDDDESLDD